MLKPRKRNGLKEFYFSTNISSMRVKQYLKNPDASIYFYHKGLIKYVGVMLKGKMKVITDDGLYVNSEKILSFDADEYFSDAYITRDLVYFMSYDYCGYSIKYAMNKDGKIIKVNNPNNYSFNDIIYDNDMFIAMASYINGSNEEIGEDYCSTEIKVQFIHNDGSILVKEKKQ